MKIHGCLGEYEFVGKEIASYYNTIVYETIENTFMFYVVSAQWSIYDSITELIDDLKTSTIDYTPLIDDLYGYTHSYGKG